MGGNWEQISIPTHLYSRHIYFYLNEFYEINLDNIISRVKKRKGSHYLYNKNQHRAAIIIVMTSPPTINLHLRSVTTTLGERVIFYCRVGGLPRPQIQWLDPQGKLIIDEFDRYVTVFFDDGLARLEIVGVKEADAGRYTCMVTNSEGEACTSALLKLVEHVPHSSDKRKLY
ncbi:hypothetical protein HELRODRAFT_190163 [Helobdella robusta]|uniref:Ig-like domain-containing protein n=1 Tax=Helobdella robusta TaxID=6412 RepID=T1FRR3_HELRO|nr:hypothetical protein HELRODRAFT_190163 [Helobdella robusta]ESO10759.1 hypothetical protein HELRODRAFT_190163 [Helobdella robusta]